MTAYLLSDQSTSDLVTHQLPSIDLWALQVWVPKYRHTTGKQNIPLHNNLKQKFIILPTSIHGKYEHVYEGKNQDLQRLTLELVKYLSESQQEQTKTIMLSHWRERKGYWDLSWRCINLKQYADRNFVRRNRKSSLRFENPSHFRAKFSCFLCLEEDVISLRQ